MKQARKIPTAFASEAEERAYWEREDSTADLDWRRAKRVRMPNLQPSTTAISLRLPVSLLEQIKIAAHKRDVPYPPPRLRLAHGRLHLLFWPWMARIKGWPK
jgi:predicted DNA binding CopG/RHH family protein